MVKLKDYIFIANYSCHTIQVFDKNGKYIRHWGSSGSGDGQLNQPSSLAKDKNGLIYVAEYGNKRIQVFNEEGKFIRKWNLDAGCWSGICINDNEIYCCLYNQIVVYSLEGKFGSSGSIDGQFSHPTSVVVDNDKVYIADQYNHRIQVLTKDGKFIFKWGSNGTSDGQFNYPFCIVIVGEYVYVCEECGNRIQVFRKNGEYVSKWGKSGNGESEFSTPLGLLFDEKEGLLYVSESGNNRIQVFK